MDYMGYNETPMEGITMNAKLRKAKTHLRRYDIEYKIAMNVTVYAVGCAAMIATAKTIAAAGQTEQEETN